MAKKTFIVTKPNVVVKQKVDGALKPVKLPVNAEYTAEEKDVKFLTKSGRLTLASDVKKAKVEAVDGNSEK